MDGDLQCSNEKQDAPDNLATQRGLKNRHVKLIRFGGAVGTALFVTSGQALRYGGPASLFIGYTGMAASLFCLVTAMAEVGAYLPVHGASIAYQAHRYVSPSLGFAMGFLQWYSIGILVTYEITAASLVTGYWDSTIHVAVWISIMLVVVVGLNFMPVSVYGESEFWFSGIKIITTLGLLLLSIILLFGGGPKHQRLGIYYWKSPGSFNTYILQRDPASGRFLGWIKCFVSSAFAFIFTPELIIVTGGEMQSPRRNIPIAARHYIYRLGLFYILGVLAIGLICPSNSSSLLAGGAGLGSSPFVIGIKNAGIPVLDSIVNVVILIAAWSSGNAFPYISSRSLYSLAVSGSAPRFFTTCNRWDVPYRAVSASSLFCLLAYLSAGSSSAVVFNYVINFTNSSGFISWVCCCVIHLRFKKAVNLQGVELPYKSWVQPYGAYVALCASLVLCLINGFDVFFPQKWSLNQFITSYIGIPAFLALYLGHHVVRRGLPWAWAPGSVDLQTDLHEVIISEHPPALEDSRWKKLFSFTR